MSAAVHTRRDRGSAGRTRVVHETRTRARLVPEGIRASAGLPFALVTRIR